MRLGALLIPCAVSNIPHRSTASTSRLAMHARWSQRQVVKTATICWTGRFSWDPKSVSSPLWWVSVSRIGSNAVIDRAEVHRWNVHFDRLSSWQHELISLPFDEPQLITGTAGSGLSTVAAFRSAALLQAGPALRRPRPAVLCSSYLRMLSMRHLLGPLSQQVDLSTVGDWLIRRYVTTTGESPPPPESVDWIDLASRTLAAGAKPAPSVVLDDAHHLLPELLVAVRVSTHNPFFTAHSTGIENVTGATGLPEGGTLNRRRRQPRVLIDIASAWGAPPASSDTEGRAGTGAVLVRNEKVPRVVLEALGRWRKDTSRRLAIATFVPEHVGLIADLLLDQGLASKRLFSSDLPRKRLASFDVGQGGIYILKPRELEGLEFDEVVVTGAQRADGGLSESGLNRQLQAIANCCTDRLEITWSDTTKTPAAVMALTGIIAVK